MIGYLYGTEHKCKVIVGYKGTHWEIFSRILCIVDEYAHTFQQAPHLPRLSPTSFPRTFILQHTRACFEPLSHHHMGKAVSDLAVSSTFALWVDYAIKMALLGQRFPTPYINEGILLLLTHYCNLYFSIFTHFNVIKVTRIFIFYELLSIHSGEGA